jgi:hypothetical protein
LYSGSGLETAYLECSRKALIPIASSRDVEFFTQKAIRGNKKITIKQFIENKLECNPQQIVPFLAQLGFKSLDCKLNKGFGTHRKNAKKIFDFYLNELKEKMQRPEQNALLYLKKSGALERNVAFCDIGYKSTIQRIINLANEHKESLALLMFADKSAEKAKCLAIGFLANQPSALRMAIITQSARLLETIVFSAPSGRVIGYDDNGTPILQSLNSNEQKRLQANEAVWMGITDFAVMAKERFGDNASALNFSKKDISRLFFNFVLAPAGEDVNLFKGIVFEDQWQNIPNKDLISDKQWKFGAFAAKGGQVYNIYRRIASFVIKTFGLADKK